jgi:lipopolysaccharide export system protein LptA
MKVFCFILLLLLLFNGCQFGQDSNQDKINNDIHKVTVKEVLQTSGYTYLLVNESTTETWLALPKMNASPGEIYYYKNGFEVTNFESKELNRKFGIIYFLESISSTPDLKSVSTPVIPPAHPELLHDSSGKIHYTANIKVQKEEVDVVADNRGVTIADIFKNKAKYNGKTVRIKGKVTKFNQKIMGSNWIHMQDGSDFEGNFDLTVRTEAIVGIGETVVLEGKVSLDKDFGYGYKYQVLIEDAKIITE